MKTEDRELFSTEMVKINEKIAPSKAAKSMDEAVSAASEVRFSLFNTRYHNISYFF